MDINLQYLNELVTRKPKPMIFEQAAEHLEQQGLRYELEERAAILEYDGGLNRDEAEKQAVKEIFERNR